MGKLMLQRLPFASLPDGQALWNDIKMFCIWPRTQKYVALTLGLIAVLLCVTQLSLFIWGILNPPSKQVVLQAVTAKQAAPHSTGRAMTESDYLPLKESTWFGSSSLLESQQLTTEQVIPETTLNLTLKGTIMGASPRAIVRDNTASESKVLKEDEEILSGIRVEQIFRRRITVNNRGKIENLSLPSANAVFSENQEERIITEVYAPHLDITKQEPKDDGYIPLAQRKVERRQEVQVSRKDILSAFTNIGGLATEARFLPLVKTGKLEGFKMINLKHDGFLKKLSLQEGDILVKLNDVPVTQRDKLFNMLTGMAKADSAELVLQRSGQMIALKFVAN